MQISNQDFWDKGIVANQDPYGNRCFTYARDWADLMEPRIANGDKLEDIAESTSHQADTDGITGFMYGAAVWILSQCWIHGEQLRKWHNLTTQLGDEGEKANNVPGRVLNPAILNIG